MRAIRAFSAVWTALHDSGVKRDRQTGVGNNDTVCLRATLDSLERVTSVPGVDIVSALSVLVREASLPGTGT